MGIKIILSDLKGMASHPNIQIYDNVLTQKELDYIYSACFQAPYEIGWGDTVSHRESFFHSTIDIKVWDRVRNGSWTQSSIQHRAKLNQTPYNIVNILSKTEPCKKLKNNRLSRGSIINLDTIADTHAAHDHKDEIVVLLYVNPFWEPSWGGETMFHDSVTNELIHVLPYTPNRMVVFDGNIMHSFNGPNIESLLKNRFSISTFFFNEEQTKIHKRCENKPESEEAFHVEMENNYNTELMGFNQRIANDIDR